MKTVALLVMARMALAWICVLGGRTPLARRVMMDFGSCSSCVRSQLPGCELAKLVARPNAVLPVAAAYLYRNGNCLLGVASRPTLLLFLLALLGRCAAAVVRMARPPDRRKRCRRCRRRARPGQGGGDVDGRLGGAGRGQTRGRHRSVHGRQREGGGRRVRGNGGGGAWGYAVYGRKSRDGGRGRGRGIALPRLVALARRHWGSMDWAVLVRGVFTSTVGPVRSGRTLRVAVGGAQSRCCWARWVAKEWWPIVNYSACSSRQDVQRCMRLSSIFVGPA